MNDRWERLARRVVHETPFLTLYEDRVRTPTGAEAHYGVVGCGQCVGVLPFVDDERVLLVRQHRYIAGRFTWEMPTGGVDPGEAVEDAAQRELAEEAGVSAGRLVPVSTYHTSKSSIDETAHLFLGYDLRPARAVGDDSDLVERHTVPFERALRWVLHGEITDGMTVIAVLLADRIRRGL